MRPGGACTACPGFSLSRWTEPQPPRRDDGQSHSTAPDRQPPTAATEDAQSHATGQGYRGTGKPRNRPQSRPQRAHRRKQSTAPGTIPPETPTNAPQSHAGRGCYPYTTRRQNAPQRRTEPPTEGKPPGVQKRRGEQAHSRHSPGTAPRAKIRAVFCDFSGDFLRFFPALSRSRGEFHSRKSIVESRLPPEVGAGLIVGKSLSRSAPRPHSPKVAWSGRRRCTSPGFHRLNTRFPVQRSE